MLFDSHAHLQFPQFDNDREEIIKKLRDFDIKIINVGNNMEESKKAAALAVKYPNQMWAAVGFHPGEATNTDINFSELKGLAKNNNIVAIGECGLDYYRSPGNQNLQNLQKDIFIKQIELAQELNKPLILHCRPTFGTIDAYEDAINIIENLKFKIKNYHNGVAHFFSGSKEIAKKFLDLGFYISFAGPITYSEEYIETIKYVPMDKILTETDSPFAAPVPYRGKRNEPAFVEYVARRIALWKDLSFEEVAKQTTENAAKLLLP